MTKLHVHALAGCTPTPLARYLKGLAVLRLVSEQRDSKARAFFRDDVFHLVTALDRAELERFFVDEYAPTPLVTPWNGGSGFYPKDAKQGIDAIVASTTPRLSAYRATIAAARALVGERTESPKDAEKLALLGACRAVFEGAALEWVNAAVALAGDADGRTGYPALLGTGGNDGRLDFANNFMQRIDALLLRGEGARTIGHALFDTPSRGLVSGAIGQFFPGGAGGANATAGFDGSSLFDAWDFVLMLEGAVVLPVAASRRLDAAMASAPSGPFSVHSSAAGYGSAAGAEKSARGEQWMPLWSKPATLDEVRSLFIEGRMECGAAPAQRAVDAARALARLGVSRGIHSFERYGYIERNGLSNFAVPLGRWVVPQQPPPHLHLLDEVAPWIDTLRRASRSTAAPASLARDVQTIEDAIFDVCRGGHVPERWERLLVALGAAEANLVARRKATKELRLAPLPRLSIGWVAAAYHAAHALELRLATALASQVTSGDVRRSAQARLGPIRAHCLPLDARSFAGTHRFATVGDGLSQDPRVVWHGRDLVADLCAVVLRRLMEAQAVGLVGTGLEGAVSAPPEDLAAFVVGQTDDGRLASLARPLMAIDFGKRGARDVPWVFEADVQPDVPLALFHLLYSTQTQKLTSAAESGLRTVRPDPGPARRLVAGDLAGATEAALARLRAMGVRPRIHRLAGSGDLARRLGASLAFPLSPRDLRRALRVISKPNDHAEATALTQE